MTTGKLELSGGIVSARVPVNGYADAAVVGSTAGIELAIENVVVHVGTDPSMQRANPVLTLALEPATMQQLTLMLCEKLGWPALVANEWRLVAVALHALANMHDEHPSAGIDPAAMRALGERIAEAVSGVPA
jgi:hypothetical protein